MGSSSSSGTHQVDDLKVFVILRERVEFILEHNVSRSLVSEEESTLRVIFGVEQDLL